MSEDDFHVHAVHEHELEHQANQGPGLAQWVAIFTAILSTLGAVVSYQTAATQNQALLYKNEAVLKKAQASDQWNYYQAKSTKGHLMELAADLVPAERRAQYQQKLEKYEQEKQEIKVQAESLEKQSVAANDRTATLLHPLHRFEQAMTFIQISISLASITVLTRKHWLFVVAGVAAVNAIALTAIAFFA